MPVLDGLETIQVIRHLDPNLPIIAASGRDVSDKVAHIAHLGVKHFLPKPYSASRLLTVLAQILKK